MTLPPAVRLRRDRQTRTAITALLVLAFSAWARAVPAGQAPPTPAQQSAADATLRSSMLYNFAKFTHWPGNALATGGPIVLCVVGDSAVAGALRETTMGRKIAGRALIVREPAADGRLQACQMLYVAGADARLVSDVLSRLGRSPVFSVGDSPVLTRLGGVAHLFTENGRLRFAINVEAAGRAGLRLNSRFLELAVIVKEPHHEPRQ